jgi:hypothetical protein
VKLRRVAEDEHRYAERHQVAPKLGVDHRAFVDHDQRGLGDGRVVPKMEVRRFLAALARLVDEAVDRGCAVGAFGAHHQRGLAGEGRELHLAIDAGRDVLGERGLAGARIAEQAEKLRRALARPLLEPGRDGLQRGILMGREDRHGSLIAASVGKRNMIVLMGWG